MSEISTFWSMIIIAGIISFLGFLLENAWLVFTKGYADNRNMRLPFLLGYGIIVLGMYYLFGTPGNMGRRSHTDAERYFLYFAAAFLTVSVGEILLGTFVEHFFGFEYWNYSRLPLHFTKYTSVPTSIGFAYCITEFMDKVFPVLLEFTGKLPVKTASLIGSVLLILLPLDFFISFAKMYRTRKLNTIWTIHVLPKGIPEMISEKHTKGYSH
ncbi:MAG: putative ABC transporter permease [Huintestinicola sp.]